MKLTLRKWVVWSLLGLLAFLQQSMAQNCAEKYQVLESHSACQEASPNLVQSDISLTDMFQIVSLHNYIRGFVKPSATNMQTMLWDDEIAMVAQKWANTCPPGSDLHDDSLARSIPGRFAGVGQNAASGLNNWVEAIYAWQSENIDFEYGVEPRPGIVVGHYTQLVWAASSLIGCGWALCEGDRSVYICNYAPGGNRRSSTDPLAQYKPYESGEVCAACPDNCLANLCSCGVEKTCYNGGILDPDTCTCSCLKSFHVGERCDLDCDQAEDSFLCESQGGSVFPEDSCGLVYNAPDECPVQCLFCPGRPTRTTEAPPATTSLGDLLSTKTTPNRCDCASLLVSGPSELADFLGIYTLQECPYRGTDAFLHSSGRWHLFFEASEFLWQIGSGLGSADVYIRVIRESSSRPYAVTQTWEVLPEDKTRWSDIEGFDIECMCDEVPPECFSVEISSANLNHTFPGSFTYTGTYQNRPFYLNAEHGLTLYFHQGASCSFWSVAPNLGATQWVMQVYDISAKPYEISSTWRVGGEAGWREDDTIKVVCVG